MKELLPDHLQDVENMNESEKLDHAFFDMEMLYKSRCVNVPLTSNVKVVDVDEVDEEE